LQHQVKVSVHKIPLNIFNVSERTVTRWINSYLKEGTLERKQNKNVVNCKITEQHIQWLVAYNKQSQLCRSKTTIP